MLQRYLAALLAVLLIISLTACADRQDVPPGGSAAAVDDGWIPLEPIIDWGDGEFDQADSQPDYPIPTMTLEQAQARLVPGQDGVVPLREAEDIIALSVLVNSGDTTHHGVTYHMQNDISLAELAFPPIGGGETLEAMNRFEGIFDGGNNLLSGVSVLSTVSNAQGSGLFGAVGANGSVRNLHVVQGVVYGGEMSGGIAGYNAGSLYNCSFAGDVVTKSAYVGGLCGLLDEGGTIEGCFTGAQVEGNLYAGGFAGYTGPGSAVRNCYSTGRVTAVSGSDSPTQIGGFIGRQEHGDVVACYASMEVYTRVPAQIVGGFIGYNAGEPALCYYNETATANFNAVGANFEDGQYDITGCTPSELTEQSTYVGWDFAGAWGIQEGRTRGMPFLRAAWDDEETPSGGGELPQELE